MSSNLDQAQQIADLFTKLAGEVDDFRNAHYDTLTSNQRADLEEDIQQLFDFHDSFAGDAIQNTTDALQGDLTTLANVTQQATQTLKHLNNVQQIVNIIAAASTIAQDIIIADYGGIPEALRSLAQAVQTPSDKPSSGP